MVFYGILELYLIDFLLDVSDPFSDTCLDGMSMPISCRLLLSTDLISGISLHKIAREFLRNLFLRICLFSSISLPMSELAKSILSALVTCLLRFSERSHFCFLSASSLLSLSRLVSKSSMLFLSTAF